MNWKDKIAKAEKWLQPVVTRGNKVYRRYKDERDNDMFSGMKKINLFYSNVNTISSSLFNSLPVPDVTKLQKGDFNDDVSRVASLIVQRALIAEINSSPTFKPSVEAAILDRLVPGIGTTWIRFDQKIECAGCEVCQAEGMEGKQCPNAQPTVGTESLNIDQVYWEDFIYEPARSWAEVSWVGRKLNMTKDEIVKNWGEDAYDNVEKVKNTNETTPKEILKDKYCIYEIWDKDSKTVLHIAKGMEEPLDKKPDPYHLKDFYPCPCPLIANPTTSSYSALPDYYFAQDQYEQLDVLYARISLIVSAIKVAGMYDSANKTSLQQMLQGDENTLIPVDNWAMLQESGGSQGIIQWYPVEKIVQVLQSLQAQYEALKAALYEVTGMSDIMRGASNQYETAKAQEIKAGFASVRMNAYQRDVSIFVSEMLAIMAEIMTQLYSDQKLAEVVGNLSEPDMQYAEQALELLRNDFLASCRVSIKTDSLTQSDWALEKGQRTELMGVISQFLQQAVPAIQQVPEMATILISMLKFTISGYKGSAEIEGVLDQALTQMEQQAQQPKEPPPPSPEEMKMQGEMQMAQQQMEMDSQKMQMEAQIKQQEAQQRMQLEQAKVQATMQMERERHALEMQKLQAELAFKQAELVIKQQEMQMKMVMDKETHEHKMEITKNAPVRE